MVWTKEDWWESSVSEHIRTLRELLKTPVPGPSIPHRPRPHNNSIRISGSGTCSLVSLQSLSGDFDVQPGCRTWGPQLHSLKKVALSPCCNSFCFSAPAFMGGPKHWHFYAAPRECWSPWSGGHTEWQVEPSIGGIVPSLVHIGKLWGPSGNLRFRLTYLSYGFL